MNHRKHSKIVSFIWGIADDVLRGVYTRGKYRDVILPMTVIRRLDALLEPRKDEILQVNEQLKEMGVGNRESGLKAESEYNFYNTFKLTLGELLDAPDDIKANFTAYLNGFSKNVQDIIAKFKLRNQINTLDEAGILFALIQKFVDPKIHLGPEDKTDNYGNVTQPGLSTLGMGYVFEELVRKFNEENNEEAGEHFTPRDIVQLMTHPIFQPVAGEIKNAAYSIYDPACGSGGMLTEAHNFVKEGKDAVAPKAKLHLFGQELNPETYAICKSDMLIKGEDPERIVYGSTLSEDAFGRQEFDFMLSNPPYGTKWKKDKEAIEPKKGEIIDARFEAQSTDFGGNPETIHLTPRIGEGQLLFLVNMLRKMKTDAEMGSRLATVHSGSALFTGNAGQGMSEIRRWILENDWLEAIIGLPKGMFYNTGINTQT
jgi:type I restriction enzyme M protein